MQVFTDEEAERVLSWMCTKMPSGREDALSWLKEGGDVLVLMIDAAATPEGQGACTQGSDPVEQPDPDLFYTRVHVDYWASSIEQFSLAYLAETDADQLVNELKETGAWRERLDPRRTLLELDPMAFGSITAYVEALSAPPMRQPYLNHARAFVSHWVELLGTLDGTSFEPTLEGTAATSF